MTTPLRQELQKLASAVPAMRTHLVPLLREARVVPEKLRLKYVNLGDFGGTIPIEDSYSLEIAGPTFEYRDTLKRLGLKFDPRSKTWGIHAELLKYTNRRNSMEWDRLRKLQEAAFPVLQKLVKDHNERIEAEIKSQRVSPDDAKGFVEMMRRHERMSGKLKAAGIVVEWKFPGKYDVDEIKVFVSGNTFPIKDTMRKHGFKWDGGAKKWWMPGDDYRVVGDAWMGEVIRQLPKEPAPPQAPAVGPFSAMSDRELHDFLSPFVTQAEVENEGWDGEMSWGEAMAGMKLRLRRLAPAEQVEQFEKLTRERPGVEREYSRY